MSRRRRRNGLGKRCRCSEADRKTCSHPVWCRIYHDGKRYRVNLSERFPGEPIEVAAAKARNLVRKGLLVGKPSDARLTFGDIADRFIRAHPQRGHHYLKIARGYDVPAAHGTTVKLEAKPVDDLTAADVRAVAAQWLQRPQAKSGAKQGAAAERTLLATLRHILNWSVAEGLALRTPFKSAQGVSVIKIRSAKPRTRRLESGEAEKILSVATPYVRDFFTAMLELGCRPGELRSLQWSEVRADEVIILAAKAKDREERRLPIMPNLRSVLDRRRLGPDGQPLPDTAFVFGNETGEEISRRVLCLRWAACCEAAKIVGLHLHDLRAEAASQLAAAPGVSLADVRDALGHANVSTTSTYLRSRQSSLKEAFSKRARSQLRLARGGPMK
jgi:integrase